MFEVRSDEPKYAFLWDKETKKQNRYGKDIELSAADSELRNKSLSINGEEGIGDNPNRYKQHGFYFNADNCIGCHACESACSEKNDNPAHIAFRSVGFVEGGSYPDYQRLNISMACNHCDDPVCLKGCPTRAYTKFAEYGAVLQDPDICFGCGYCTWVCPYNAPQLDPVKGEVSKCNMCVDRLEVGLKPACVSACLGNALDFGVIENTPDNRIESKADIPGFPTTDITNPNIRFQQTRSTQREMTRTDSAPIKYNKDDSVGRFVPTVDKKDGEEKHWNWGKLLFSHESAHVLFTLCAQATLGALLIQVIGSLFATDAILAMKQSAAFMPLLLIMFAIFGFGMFKLNMHLGKPHRFYRGFNNLRYSPISREIAGVSGLFVGFGAYTFLSFFGESFSFIANIFSIIGAISGVIGVYYMYKIYRIKARPFWDHWQTGAAFFGNTLSLGALLTGLVALPIMLFEGSDTVALIQILSTMTVAGIALEIIGHRFHSKDMQRLDNEGAASWYQQSTKFGKSWLLRNGLLGFSLVLSIGSLAAQNNAVLQIALWVLLAVSLLSACAISRSLFFVLVIPTTMPGAFFWKNQGFAEHAKESGLADMEQVGVVRERHSQFKLDELLATLKTTSPKEMFKQARDILVWKKVK